MPKCDRPIRVGIIGVGFGAAVHVPAMLGLPDVHIAAVADGGSGRARALAEKIASIAGCAPAVCTDGFAVVQRPDVDFLIVATPPSAQFEFVMASIGNGKSVLCEKPFGATLAQAEQMAAAAEGRPGVYAVGFQLRYELASLIDLVTSGAIGRVCSIEVSWVLSGDGDRRQPLGWRKDEKVGSVLCELGSHVLDYLSVLGGGPITEVLRFDASGSHAELLVAVNEVECHVLISRSTGSLGHRITVYGETGRLTYHRRPPYTIRDCSLTREDRAGVHEVHVQTYKIAELDADTRTPAVRSLISGCVDKLKGGSPDRLPDFGSGLRVRRTIARIVNSDGA